MRFMFFDNGRVLSVFLRRTALAPPISRIRSRWFPLTSRLISVKFPKLKEYEKFGKSSPNNPYDNWAASRSMIVPKIRVRSTINPIDCTRHVHIQPGQR
ncbi:hypothetical protein TMatcc_010232 [Talaromyces marneffei ATCC 18224]